MTPDEEIQRSERIKQFLRDPILERALDEVHENLVDEWKAATTPEAREAKWAEMAGYTRILQKLYEWRDSGDMATTRPQRLARASLA